MFRIIRSLYSHAAAALMIAALVGVAPAVAATNATAPADADPAYASWFRYSDEATAFWDISEVPGDPYQVSIHPKDSVSGTRQRVFVVYPRPSSAYDVAITKILTVFAEKDINAEFRVFNFRKSDEHGKEAVRMAEDGDYDMIFSMGSESTAWLYENYRGGRVPVVSVCSKDPVLLGQADSYDKGSSTNFAFTSLNMPVEVQMAYVLDLKPGLKNLGVLVNSQNVSAMQTQAEPIAKYARKLGIRVLNLAIRDPATAKEELAGLVSSAVAAMRKNDPTLDHSVFWITGSTAVFREIATINAHADRVPVLSVVPEVVTAGDDSAVLSIGVSFESNAHLAAIYGADVLFGRANVGDLKVGIVTPPDIAINFRKAREIGLNIPFSFFERASFVYDYEGRPVRTSRPTVIRTN